MAWYTKNYSYPIPRWKFPHRLKDENGKSYTGANAFNNRHKLGWIDVSPPPQFDEETQVMFWKGDEWVVRDKTNEELQTANNTAWAPIREIRDNILLETDWTQIPASNNEFGILAANNIIDFETSYAYENYRQELRDLPQTYSDVRDIVWPQVDINNEE